MTRDLLEQAAKALEIAQRWLANSMPTVELDGPKPLPIIAAARSALLAELAREPWTREAPTVPGWYWLRWASLETIAEVYLAGHWVYVRWADKDGTDGSKVSALVDASWSGPILCPAAPASEGGAK